MGDFTIVNLLSLVNEVFLNHYLPIEEDVIAMHDLLSHFSLLLKHDLSHIFSIYCLYGSRLESHAYFYLGFLLLYLDQSSLPQVVIVLIRSVNMILSLSRLVKNGLTHSLPNEIWSNVFLIIIVLKSGLLKSRP